MVQAGEVEGVGEEEDGSLCDLLFSFNWVGLGGSGGQHYLAFLCITTIPRVETPFWGKAMQCSSFTHELLSWSHESWLGIIVLLRLFCRSFAPL